MLGILWVKVLAAGGMLPLYLKELALVVIFLFFVERICYTKKKTATEGGWPMAHMVPSLQ